MEEMLTGLVLALVALVGVVGFFFLRTTGLLIQVLPLGDGHIHTGTNCDCLPQTVLSAGRTLVLHHDLRDEAELEFDFS